LSGRAKGFDALEAMHLACNRYLSRVDRDPNNYVDALLELREALVEQVDALCASDKELHKRSPGCADRKNLPGCADGNEVMEFASLGSPGLSSQ
jgi:hypothetical protein